MKELRKYIRSVIQEAVAPVAAPIQTPAPKSVLSTAPKINFDELVKNKTEMIANKQKEIKNLTDTISNKNKLKNIPTSVDQKSAASGKVALNDEIKTLTDKLAASKIDLVNYKFDQWVRE